MQATPIERSFCTKPKKPEISENNSNLEAPILSSSTPSGNQWLFNGTPISGATNQTLVISEPGIYSVQVTVDDCKSEFSSETNYVFTGDNFGPSYEHGFTVFPNPFDQEINVSWNNSGAGENKMIIIIDVLGQKLYEKSSQEQQSLITISNIKSGFYLIRGVERGNVYTQRIFKIGGN